jgi:hypothetical protein
VFESAGLFHAVMEGSEIFCEAKLERHVIVGNYREAQCPDLKLEPKDMLVRDIDRGLIPFGIPEWEGEQVDRVLTIRRIGYILIIQTYLHDLGVILRYLDGWRLIRRVRCPSNLLIFTIAMQKNVWNPVPVF